MGCRNGGEQGKGSFPRVLEVRHQFAGQQPVKAVCTTGMVADLVRNVGGRHVEVEQLMGHGSDPHGYEATPADTNKLATADIVFYSGLHLEGKMADVLERSARDRAAFPVAEYVVDSNSLLEDDENQHDPHVWFDVSLWRKAAGVVRDILVQYDPANAEDYKARATKYMAELGKLHDEAKRRLASIPKERRVMVTSHDAFRYFGRAYDIEVMGIQGISTVDEASPKRINDLAALLTAREIKAVFVESTVNPGNMETLIRECKSRGHAVRKIDTPLYSDAMGKPGTLGETYPGMVRHNVNTIVEALK
jgi:manganese/zinc/iron transport system substrate-binding protein